MFAKVDPNELIKRKILYPHERLIELIDEVDVSRVARLYSLDSREKRILVPGVTHDEVSETLREILELLRQDFTVTRRLVQENRIEYYEKDFFVSRDGYYADRPTAIGEILALGKEIALQVQRLIATPQRSLTLKHNLEQASVIIDDLLVFVEALNFERQQRISGDPVRHS